MPDTIYDDLKQQGLILSDGVVLQLPPIRPPRPSLIKQVSGLAPEFKIAPGPHKVVLLPILNSAILVGRANTLICYKFELDKQLGKPVFLQPKIENLSFCIKALHICDNKFLNDRGEVPFLIESEDQLTLYNVNLKEYKLTESNSFSYSKLYSVRFLCQKQILLLTRELELHHFTIQNGKMRMKNKKMSAALPAVPNDQYIQNCQIVGSIDEEQDSIVVMFYLIKKKKKQDTNFQILKVKQYLRTFQGKIEPQEEDYTVLMNTHSSVLPEGFVIWCLDGYYCIETKHEILILRKKFKKYLFIDNVMEKIHDHSLKLNQGAIVSSYGNNTMELSVIQFGDPKCNSKILDTIELNPLQSEGFRLLWPFKNEKETYVLLVFERQKRLYFHNVIKMQPMKKMLEVVRKCEKDKISVVQEIAVNLGINKRQFYLTLWQASKRQISDIYQFLLHCGDISAIKKEIRLTMRRRAIVVPEFVKILERISQIIRNELKTNLSQQMLKEYIKNDFLLRKIKLKPKEKSLDHRDLQKVYNSSIIDIFVEIVKNKLYPQVRDVTPLHVMEIEPEKQIIELEHVLQEFKLVILENYKKFIEDFMAHFEKDQIVNVIKQYQFLLPTHPFEIKMVMHEAEYKTEVELNQDMIKKHNGQKPWFAHITSVQFNRELSKQSIERELQEYYPTSKITDAINTLVHSSYGATQKLKKHGLISCTIEEYKHKLKDICDIKLFMKVCEYANETDPFSPEGPSPALVENFKTENKLKGEAYETVRLYTSMHKFMLKNEFCEKKDSRGFTTEELINFTSEDLVALFFLENRQRKEFLFNEFRELYVQLYGNPDKFNDVIRKFILSENCSRIELEIFIKEVLSKGVEFQIENQILIELLIDGFCMKLQIRQGSDTQHFIDLMNDIELSKPLGMKLNKIMQIQRCVGILNVFHCQKFTYLEMLAYQKDNEIFKILLQRFFDHQLKRDSVRIEDEEVSLDYCRNMLTVLLYILETIYYDVPEKELLLTYGETLIMWKQFDVIKGILYDEDVLEKLNVNKAEYVDELVRKALSGIYTDQSIEFDEEVKRQIEDILDIMSDDSSPLRKQELAKLKLVQIFEGWEVLVHPFDIHYVCEEWNNNNGREDFIVNLFDVYLEKLTLLTLQEIYEYLEYTGEGDSERQITLYNSEFVRFVLMFAQRLLDSKRYDQIIEIFAFVKTMNGTVIEFELLTEAFLKSVSKDFGEEDKLEQGKELIEYFTQNVEDDQTLHRLFETKLSSGRFGEGIDRENAILMNENYCFKKNRKEIGLDLLWSIVINEREELKKAQSKISFQISDVYYSYYFLLSSLRNPANGLRRLDKISYNLELLTNLVFRLYDKIENTITLWAINTIYIIKSFIKGLLLIGVGRVKGDSTSQFKHQEDNVEVIKNVLKQDKMRNKDLLDCIQRLEDHLNTIKMKSKEARYDKCVEEELKAQPQQIEVEPLPEIIVSSTTMKLRTMREMKFEQTQNISNLTANFLSENQILNKIYEAAQEDKKQERARQKRSAATGNNLFLTGMNNEQFNKKQNSQKEIVDKILKEEFEAVLSSYPKQEIVHAVKVIYEEGRKDFYESIRILDTLKVGERQRIDISRLCKIYQGDIPTEDLQRIFPFHFFTDTDHHYEEELGPKVYEAIRENIQHIFMERNNEYIRSIATFVGSVLESNVFIDLVYLDTLLNIGTYDFNSEAVIRFQVILDILRHTSADVIKDNIERILDSCKDNSEMRAVIKQNLQMVIREQFKDDIRLLELIMRG